MSSSAHPFVLLAGDNRPMLSTVRSLSRRDVPFAAIGPTGGGMVASSRHLRHRVVGPAPNARLEPESYVEFVLDAIRRFGAELLLPLTDATLYACDLHRAALEAETRLAAPPSHAIRNVLDKRANLDTARRLGVPCPDQFDVEDLDQIPELIAALGLPLVLKNPERPRGRLGTSFDFKWLVAHDERELRTYLADYCADGAFPLFQRLITGTAHSVCCFAVGGEIVAAHQYRHPRRVNGLSAFREITPLAPNLEEYSAAMLSELRWEGVAEVEFFVRDRDGDVRYMETNGRFWATIEGSVAAGWDFPYWTYEYFALGKAPQSPPRSLGLGRLSRWHYGELDALLRFLRGGDEPSGAGRTRARALADYLAGFHPRVDADVFRFDDPLPELVEHWQGLGGYTGRALGRVRRRRRGGHVATDKGSAPGVS